METPFWSYPDPLDRIVVPPCDEALYQSLHILYATGQTDGHRHRRRETVILVLFYFSKYVMLALSVYKFLTLIPCAQEFLIHLYSFFFTCFDKPALSAINARYLPR